MTNIIAISNHKGGVAKTTTCLSLGACLAEMGKTVLLIDLDPQASLTLSLGLKPESLRHAVDVALLGNTQAEYYAARSLRHVVDLVKLVREKTNPHLAYRVLVTMYDRRNKICHVILEQMQASLSAVLFKTIIEVDTKLRESPAFGQPITLYTPNTRGAQQYREFARELMNDGRESQASA